MYSVGDRDGAGKGFGIEEEGTHDGSRDGTGSGRKFEGAKISPTDVGYSEGVSVGDPVERTCRGIFVGALTDACDLGAR